MELHNRIAAFVALGNLLRSLTEEEKQRLFRSAKAHNNWFTDDNLENALKGICHYLEEERLKKWLAPYLLPEENPAPKKVGVVMAGNIPMVGFHDFLSVLINGHELHAKLSTQDPVLMPYLAGELKEIAPEFKDYIHFEERLRDLDAIIATGSDNSSRYFEYYFSKIPHIIRKNRSSCAILEGNESQEEFELLGRDITQYYGMGCRNVSKLFVPENYDFNPLLDSLEKFSFLAENHKFVNNYDYNKSIYLVNMVPHLDTGFMLFKEDKALVSPVSVVYYQTYQNREELQQQIREEEQKIQCIVGHHPVAEIPFGKAQQPELWDYADRVDTIAFLKSL